MGPGSLTQQTSPSRTTGGVPRRRWAGLLSADAGRLAGRLENAARGVDSLRSWGPSRAVIVAVSQNLSRASCDLLSRSIAGKNRSGSRDRSATAGSMTGYAQAAGAATAGASSLVCARSGLRLARNVAFAAALCSSSLCRRPRRRRCLGLVRSRLTKTASTTPCPAFVSPNRQ